MSDWQSKRDKSARYYAETYFNENYAMAITGFTDGYDKGRADALEDAQVLVEALEYIQTDLCVQDNQDAHKEARKALALWREKQGG
jgi:hypothetical protein